MTVARVRGGVLLASFSAWSWGASGCEVVGQVGADDLVASTSSSGTTEASKEPGSTDVGEATTSGTTMSLPTDDTSGTGEDETLLLDVGGGGSSESSESSGEPSTDESTTMPPDDLDSSSSSGSFGTTVVRCCEAMSEPGCEDPLLEACVCAADDYCCSDEWDDACVDIAIWGDCGGACDLPEVPPPGECCTPNENGPGCLDIEVQDCVCAIDPYCCEYAWDDVCVDRVDELGCGMCGG